MSNEIIAIVLRDQQANERELALLDAEYTAKRTPLLLKIEASKRYIADYRKATGTVAHDIQHVDLFADRPQQDQKLYQPREGTLRARVFAACTEILRAESPLKTAALVERLEAMGVHLTAANKAGNLSVLLSRNDAFVSNRSEGWSLKSENPAATGFSSATESDIGQTTLGS